MEANNLEWFKIENYDLEELAQTFDQTQASVRIMEATHKDDIRKALEARAVSSRQEQQIGFVIEDLDTIVGIGGLSLYKGNNGIQTYTYLVDSEWGKGYNKAINQVLASVCFDVLGEDKLYASINADNARSHKGFGKVFPGCIETKVFEPWHQREAILLEMNRDNIALVDVSSLGEFSRPE